jgi:hypothetical protein
MRQVADECPAAASGARRRRIGRLDYHAISGETALVTPGLIAMIVGIIDLSRIFTAEIQLSQAAHAEMNFYNKGNS